MGSSSKNSHQDSPRVGHNSWDLGVLYADRTKLGGDKVGRNAKPRTGAESSISSYSV
jgi:hypothetical protein